MTDLKMTQLCAEALLPNVWAHGEWNPLHDDAQAMALMKRFMLDIDAFVGMAQLGYGDGDRFTSYSDESLNRAIVECVAKMQAAKVST